MDQKGALADKLRIGCSGWGYKDWINVFYPSRATNKDFLKFYSSIFDAVEIDSSFYRTPSLPMIRSWYEKTPKDFLFTAKLPKKITHEKHLAGVDVQLDWFEKSIKGLREKLGGVVVQLPPSFKVAKDKARLADFLKLIDPKVHYAIEFRHISWFEDQSILPLLRDHNVSLCWTINQYLETPKEVTSDHLYLRFVGDRSITEFKGIQKDQKEKMMEWHKELLAKEDSFKDAFVFFNNHFAGFGPSSVNEFRRLSGLIEKEWTTSEKGEASPNQASLSDF